MGKILKTGLLLISISSFLTACNDESCTESTSVNARISFYKKSDNLAFSIDSMSVKGIGQINDSLLLNKSRNLNSLQLPLRVKSDITEFILNFFRSNSASADQTDTIRFFHQNRPQYISPVCGCTIFYHIDSVSYTKNRIDTVIITQPEITNYDEEHIQILF